MTQLVVCENYICDLLNNKCVLSIFIAKPDESPCPLSVSADVQNVVVSTLRKGFCIFLNNIVDATDL